MLPELPTGSRSQLLNYINEVSFAAYDALLFLDTHPDDADALAYFRKH
ncbi:MAG: spore coat protein CotJB, partial [Lachnospiraceae bacterium]|nr:spore coat protein CotJB [Lachnospiraceae bacterium]